MENETTKTALIEFLIEQIQERKEVYEFTANQPHNQFTDIIQEDRKKEIRQLVEFIEFVGSK